MSEKNFLENFLEYFLENFLQEHCLKGFNIPGRNDCKQNTRSATQIFTGTAFFGRFIRKISAHKISQDLLKTGYSRRFVYTAAYCFKRLLITLHLEFVFLRFAHRNFS